LHDGVDIIVDVESGRLRSSTSLDVARERTPLFYRGLYKLRSHDVILVEESVFTKTSRWIFHYPRSLGSPLRVVVQIKPPYTTYIVDDILVVRSEGTILYLPNYIVCYGENTIGPYNVVVKSGVVKQGVEGFEVSVGDESRDCDWQLIMASKAEGTPIVREWMFTRLFKGYYEDGLIWALIREGRASRSSLPSFIEDGQAYYWPRGDILRSALYDWFQNDNPLAWHVYSEILEQMLRMQSADGGLIIPYVTAARWRDIYGSPQQLYVFESLYRAYQLTGVEIFRERALKALECYTIQPPRCLGYYEVDEEGGLFFRWGSYHYLSTDPEKREDLRVLNTHLMGVVGLLEGWVLEGCEWCREYALRGVKGLKGLIKEFCREDGYLYYSLYTKRAIGEYEDRVRPHFLGYHVLSSRLLLRVANLLRDRELAHYGELACRHALSRLGEISSSVELVSCLVELYRWKRADDTLHTLDRVVRATKPRISLLGYALGELDDLSAIPPKIVSETPELAGVLLTSSRGRLQYYIHSYTPETIRVEEKTLPSNVRVKPTSVSARRLSTGEELQVSELGGRFIVHLSAKDSIILDVLIDKV
jgi:hypothetical protein